MKGTFLATGGESDGPIKLRFVQRVENGREKEDNVESELKVNAKRAFLVMFLVAERNAVEAMNLERKNEKVSQSVAFIYKQG